MNEKKRKKKDSNESEINKRIDIFENLKILQNLKKLKNLDIFKFSNFQKKNESFKFFKECSDQNHLANLTFYTRDCKN